MHKLYCYVDESGQDTKGLFFIVAIVIAPSTEVRDAVDRDLSVLERWLGKRTDWRHTKTSMKRAYLMRITRIKPLKGNMLYGIYRGTQDYDRLTAKALVAAIRKKRPDISAKAIIEIEGELSDTKEQKLTTALKQAGIRYQRVRGQRFKSSALIRLADAVAGFLSDRERGKSYTDQVFAEFRQQDPFEKLS